MCKIYSVNPVYNLWDMHHARSHYIGTSDDTGNWKNQHIECRNKKAKLCQTTFPKHLLERHNTLHQIPLEYACCEQIAICIVIGPGYGLDIVTSQYWSSPTMSYWLTRPRWVKTIASAFKKNTGHHHPRYFSRDILVSAPQRLVHWGRMTNMRQCIARSLVIGSDNGLPSVRHKAIIWPNAGCSSTRPFA